MADIIEIIQDVTTLTVASDGPQGPTGPTGATGATGAQGPSGVLSVTAPITNSGTSTSAVIGINAGVANGVATLDSGGKVPQSQIPAVAITNTFVVASQAAMLALTAEEGDVAVRTDLNKTYILAATPASTLGNWQELLTPTDSVTSVDGRVGTVTLSDLYAAKTHASTHASGGTDAVTLAQSQITNLTTDLAAKAPIASPALTGVPTSTTAAVDTNTTQIATTAYVVGQGYLKSATASSTYAPIASPTFTGTLTTPNVIVTGSTVPANGIYLPTANTLGLATNSGIKLQINSVGEIGVGTGPSAGRQLFISGNITGSLSGRSLTVTPLIMSDITTEFVSYRSNPATTAAAFTLGNLVHFNAVQGTFGASSVVTNQIGYYADASISGATNNFGFYGAIGAATNRWNFYAGSTAANYFSGQTTVGSTSLTLGSGSVAQQFGVVSSAATNIVEVVKGAASQSGDLTQWQNSAGTVLAKVSSSGNITLPAGGLGNINGENIAVRNTASGGPLYIDSGTGGTAGTFIFRTSSSFTAVLTITGAGQFNIVAGNTSATATAGAVTLPALAVGFITMQVAGTTVKVPYYAN